MSIYNLQYLQEMKTKEEYRRESFKKKYNYKPSKDNKDIGTIEVDGRKYNVDMSKDNLATGIDNSGKKISLDKDFFKLKGSNKNQRRDAVLQHEIGHSRLHTTNADPDKKSARVYKKSITRNIKDNGWFGFDLASPNMSKDERKDYYDNNTEIKEYVKNMDKSKIKDREKAYKTAEKYETNDKHATASEFEADRYAANRTSASAMKKALRNTYRFTKKDAEKRAKRYNLGDAKKYISGLEKDPDMKQYAEPHRKRLIGIKNQKDYEHKLGGVRDINNQIAGDYKPRSKALKDKDIQNIKLYKK